MGLVSVKRRLSSSNLASELRCLLPCAHHSQALLGEVVVDVGGLHGQVAR